MVFTGIEDLAESFEVGTDPEAEQDADPEERVFQEYDEFFHSDYAGGGVEDSVDGASSGSSSLLIPRRASISMSTYCFLRAYILREYSLIILAARSFL